MKFRQRQSDRLKRWFVMGYLVPWGFRMQGALLAVRGTSGFPGAIDAPRTLIISGSPPLAIGQVRHNINHVQMFLNFHLERPGYERRLGFLDATSHESKASLNYGPRRCFTTHKHSSIANVSIILRIYSTPAIASHAKALSRNQPTFALPTRLLWSYPALRSSHQHPHTSPLA